MPFIVDVVCSLFLIYKWSIDLPLSGLYSSRSVHLNTWYIICLTLIDSKNNICLGKTWCSVLDRKAKYSLPLHRPLTRPPALPPYIYQNNATTNISNLTVQLLSGKALLWATRPHVVRIGSPGLNSLIYTLYPWNWIFRLFLFTLVALFVVILDFWYSTLLFPMVAGACVLQSRDGRIVDTEWMLLSSE